MISVAAYKNSEDTHVHKKPGYNELLEAMHLASTRIEEKKNNFTN